jgi:hypothetical protein
MVSVLASSAVDRGFGPLTKLDFYSASSLKQQSVGRHVALLEHIMPIPSQPVFTLTP